jgi:hypothetical protein
MKCRRGLSAYAIGACALALAISPAGARAATPPLGEVNFTREVKPLLARRCFACHGPDIGEGGLRLHEKESALAELDSGAHALVPGDVEQSELIARVSEADESLRMPPEGKPLTPDEIATLKAWIEQGAEWKKHWAYVPPQKQLPPTVKNGEWVSNPIDAFILAKLEAAELAPSAEADRRALARRAYFGVTGLPPGDEELREFLDDKSADAWPRLVDRLLASPHYGEHWARHWLDVVRFAETNSFERDGPKPNAWKYRDYVIRSFNADKPYDQFVREQLAGDELDEMTDDSVIATGYYRLGLWDDEPADPVQAFADERDDIVSTTSQAFLGLTVGCARCHDHKIDPIPQKDYYGLVAFIADVTTYGVRNDEETNNQWDLSPPAQAERRRRLRRRELEIVDEKVAIEEVGVDRMTAEDQRTAETTDRQRVLDDKLQQHLSAAEWESYQAVLKRLEAARDDLRKLPPADSALALAVCDPQPEPTHVMQRGNPHALGDEVEPHFPALFGEETPEIPAASPGARSAGRRRVLAEWIASPKNMLTARVIVNRVWQQHFGRGIVRSANNFGELGDVPTHPELLDWLALWLIEHDWKLKPLHHLIMTSSAYRMSSAGNERALAVDPTNDLFWRFDMRRLSAEEVRDATLVATGQLNPHMFGPSVYPKMPEEVLATQSRPGQGWGKSSRKERSRRSVYIYVKRSLLTPLLTAFDFPDVDASCEARFITTQPGQALTMLNSEFINEQAGHLARRVRSQAGEHLRDQVAEALWVVLGRKPEKEEIKDGLMLMRRLTQEHGQEPDDALRLWCLAVLNLNEFVYLD